MKVVKLASISATFAVSACGGGGGGVMTANNFAVSNVETIAVVKNLDSIITYDLEKSGEVFKGFVITNEPSNWQDGIYQQVSLEKIEITNIIDRPRNIYVGNVMHNGINYRGFLYVNSENEKIELLMAEPSSNVNGGWNFGEDSPLPANTIIRALGQYPSSVALTGTAQYRGAIMVQGGDGKMIGSSIMEVDFDTSSATFTASDQGSGSPRIYADVLINNSDGTFSSNNLIVTFNSDIFNPQQATGNLAGNFTGIDQNGAIGAIWSDPDQTQFQGAFALDKR